MLGKGTHDLEGYELDDKGYFGPGEMPVFDRDFFAMPRGTPSEWAFNNLKQKAAADGVLSDELLAAFKEELVEAMRRENDDDEQSYVPLGLTPEGVNEFGR